jgi:hypothetical protein
MLPVDAAPAVPPVPEPVPAEVAVVLAVAVEADVEDDVVRCEPPLVPAPALVAEPLVAVVADPALLVPLLVEAAAPETP